MPKKKQEMSQVYSQNNEFIFGEKGGKGKNLLSFLKIYHLPGVPTLCCCVREIEGVMQKA